MAFIQHRDFLKSNDHILQDAIGILYLPILVSIQEEVVNVCDLFTVNLLDPHVKCKYNKPVDLRNNDFELLAPGREQLFKVIDILVIVEIRLHHFGLQLFVEKLHDGLQGNELEVAELVVIDSGPPEPARIRGILVEDLLLLGCALYF